MLERHDQSQLLALIEGELDQRSAEALQQQLARDPRAAAAVAAMLRDRDALRAMPEPELPYDFIATIEPMLTRPMLIETPASIATISPGEFRRRHQRSNRRWRIGRVAVAAALLLAAFGGSWAIIQGLSNLSNSTREDQLASNVGRDSAATPSGQSPSVEVLSDAALTVDALGPGAIHHGRPRRLGDEHPAIVASSSASVSRPSDVDDATASQADGAPTVLVADFTIVVTARDATATESRVSGALADLGSRAAFVHNFSYQEAQALAEQYRIAHGGASRVDRNGQPVTASSGAVAPGTDSPAIEMIAENDLSTLAKRVREQMNAMSQRGSPAATAPAANDAASRMLAGAPSLSPTLEQQLDLSSRGASYTIAVPASELVALIERLSLSDSVGPATILRMLPSTPPSADSRPISQTDAVAGASPTPPALIWLTEGPLVRQAMQRLSQTRGDAIVLVPVTLN